MLIPDFSVLPNFRAANLTWRDSQLYIDNQLVNVWMDERGVKLSDLPRTWVPRAALAAGYAVRERVSAEQATRHEPISSPVTNTSMNREQETGNEHIETGSTGSTENTEKPQLGAGLGQPDGGGAPGHGDDVGRGEDGTGAASAGGVEIEAHTGTLERTVGSDESVAAPNEVAVDPAETPEVVADLASQEASQAISEAEPVIPEAELKIWPVRDYVIDAANKADFESRVYGGEKKKARNNLAAIRLVSHLHNTYSRSHHGLSPDEQSTLAAYVGWGGLPKAFRDTATGEADPEWEDIVVELENLLSEEDLKAARRSTLDAHYTSVEIVSAMWKGLQAAGFKEGAVMEPAMGTGLFFALQPEAIQENTRRFGVELDVTSARISQWLYPTARIENRPFQDVTDLNDMMDVVIGNPPFGDQPIFDRFHPEWSDDAPSIHNYFFRKGLQQLQPGGIQAMVVSRYFLDAGLPAYTEFRQRFHRDAELLTAVRLPRNAFMANAGTQVVTDVLFFRRREEPLVIDDKTAYPAWVHADGIIGQDPDTGRGVPGNRYYELHPDHVLGVPALIRGMYREDEPAVLPDKNDIRTLAERIAEKIIPDLESAQIQWPESRIMAEERWVQQNRLYPMSASAKEDIPVGGFFLLHADPAVAREALGFEFEDTEDAEVVREALDLQYPPKLAVRTSGYRGFAFASEMMKFVVEKSRKNGVALSAALAPEALSGRDAEDDAAQAEGDGTDATLSDTASEPGTQTMKRAFSDTDIQRIQGMVQIRDGLQRLLRAQVNVHLSEGAVEQRRADLNASYAAFTKSFGLLNRPINKRLFRQDPFSGALLALETDYQPDVSAVVAKKTGEEARPESSGLSLIMTQRTQHPHIAQDRAETPLDALRLSLSQKGAVDPVFIQHTLRDTEWAGSWSDKIREALKDEIYLDLAHVRQEAFWEKPMIAWPYEEKAMAVSGDIIEKLQAAQALTETLRDRDILVGTDELDRLVTALEQVQPKRVPMKDIGVRFGAAWVPKEVYQQFVEGVMGAQEGATFDYQKALAKWDVSVSFSNEQRTRWAVSEDFGPKWVLERTINRQPLLAMERLRDGSTVVLEKETEIAKQKAQEIQKEWARWVHSQDEVGALLEETYNKTFNRYRAPQYDGRHLEMVGSSSAITVRPHQKNAIWRGLQSSKVFFDHAVGAGKTFAAAGLAMELRRLNRAQKPFLAVPNHLVDQWRTAFLDLYPSAMILTATPIDMEAKNRQVFLGKAAYGDWDAVIVPHSMFSRIPPDPHFAAQVMREEVSSFEDAIRDMEKTGDGDKRTLKRLERKVEKIKSMIEKNQSETGKKDQGLTMGDIGVDFLFVDEVQEFKNLPYITEMKNVAGLGNPEGSAKAQDLYVKARSIQKMREDGGGVVYLSGTPLSNTMAELYTWMRHYAYEEMERMGVLHFDAWQTAFADVTRDYAFTLTGDYKEKAYLSVFDNLPELRQLTQQFMDTVSIMDVRQMLADEGMPDMPIPPIAGGKPNVVVSQPTPGQLAYIGHEIGESEDGTPEYNPGSILDRLDHLPRRPEKGEDNILSLSGEMSKVGLDLRAVAGTDNGEADADNGQKLLRCTESVHALYQQWHEDKGTQLIFLDFSTPNASRKGKVKKPSATEQSVLDALENIRLYERHMEDYGEAEDALQEKSDRAQEMLERLSPQELEDIQDKFSHNADRWSAYEAIKRMLIEKGIPAEEIGFIHDYEKPQEKGELFGMMRSGKMRVLIGSSSKMGSGMNVQDRLVGMHHLDAPYRPLDIEQRNGRGLRQGNKLLEKYGPEKFQMSVNYYVTEGAGDAGRWQILEFKKKFIDQYAQRNSNLRRIEDPSAQALDPARIKAESSGSDILMDKTVLSDWSRKLGAAESAWHGTLRDLRAAIRQRDAAIQGLNKSLPIVAAAAQAIQSWDERAAGRQEELDAERAATKAANKAARDAAREAEKAARDAAKALAKASKATGNDSAALTSEGEAEEGDVNILELSPTVVVAASSGEADTSAGLMAGEAGDVHENAEKHSDTRGPWFYAVPDSDSSDVDHPEWLEKTDQRASDMGMDILMRSMPMLREMVVRARQADVDRPRSGVGGYGDQQLNKDARDAAGRPFLRIAVDGQVLTMVIEDITWQMESRHTTPESDDTFKVSFCWMTESGAAITTWGFTESVQFAFGHSKHAEEEYRKAAIGIGQRILNSAKRILEAPEKYKEGLATNAEQLSGYQKEYDRLTLKDGERSEDFPQQNRLTLVGAASYCLDMALKGGLRKSGILDEKIQTLQENISIAQARVREQSRQALVGAGNTLTGGDTSNGASSGFGAHGLRDDTEDLQDLVDARTREAAKMDAGLRKIDANLERLLGVAPELRYWSKHREQIVEQLKDEETPDDVFLPVLQAMQNRSNQESIQKAFGDEEALPFDESQLETGETDRYSAAGQDFLSED
jgi:N12 class adenine-specific DNA methylase/predicted RNA methylase